MMLKASDLSVKRAGREIVENADCAILPGQILAICGPNGAGKSTLMAALAGLLGHTGGELLIEGRPLSELTARERARAIGFLPQQAEAAWDVSVRTLVSLGRLPWKAVPGRPARARSLADGDAVAKALSAMQLDELADRPVSQLSGGERARAMMGRVLAGEPRFILADEPFASLDIGHARDLASLLCKQADEGLAIAVVMHDLAFAMNHADHVLVLDKGRVAASGPPQEALSEELISKVWGTSVSWLGDAGRRALAV